MNMEPPEWLFTESEARVALKKFLATLKSIEDEIKTRNYGLRVPYDVLIPSRIPYGIAI